MDHGSRTIEDAAAAWAREYVPEPREIDYDGDDGPTDEIDARARQLAEHRGLAFDRLDEDDQDELRADARAELVDEYEPPCCNGEWCGCGGTGR